MAKGKKKGPVDVFARLAQHRRDVVDHVDSQDAYQAELTDTTLTISPAIPRVEVSLNIQFRCSVPIVEGDVLQLHLPGFRGKASFFAPEGQLMQTKAFPRQFHGYWSGDGAKKGKGPGKQLMLFKCTRRIDDQTPVIIMVPRSLGLISPDKLAANSTKIKMSGVLRHAEEGKLFKHVFVSSTEVKKRPIPIEVQDYKAIMTNMESTCGMEEAGVLISEDLCTEEVDQLWEAAHDRCPYPIAFQWCIGVSAFHSYESFGPILRTIMENTINCVKQRQVLGLQYEIAENLGVKVAAVVLFQNVLNMLYGSLYPELPSAALLVVRLFTMEPIDIARTFLVTDPPQLSLAREIHSCFRIGNTKGLTKWAHTVSMLLLIASGNTNADFPSISITSPISSEPLVLYYGIKELPSEELQHIREMASGDWYVLPCFSFARPNVKWTDEDSFQVPDNAVLFEIHNAVEGLETCDVSMYPYEHAWLLPLCSSFRVRSVQVYETRNDLTHVVLDMHGCLHGSLKDSMIPEEDRTVAAVVTKKLRLQAERCSYAAFWIAERTFLNVRLNERLRLDPQTLLRAQYVDHYFEVKRHSESKRTIEEGIVSWQVCTTPAQMIDPVAGIIKHATWEPIPRKFALVAEQCFLSRTREKKTFEVSGITLDFTNYVCDYSGKGPRPMRRLLKKRVTHEAPLPLLDELLS